MELLLLGRLSLLFSEEILRAGPVHPVTLVDVQSVQGSGLCEFRRIAGDFHC